MSDLTLQQIPHRGFNPLLGEWVVVSPHRTQRPWLGKMEKPVSLDALHYDPACYLCPGNERANGSRNPKYADTLTFDNDYHALFSVPELVEINEDGLLLAESESGSCRVVCFSPPFDLTIPLMSPAEVRKVVDVWSEQFQALEKFPGVRHIKIFENRGALMGASNPHPHCQIWASASIPNIPRREFAAFREYSATQKSCLLCDYLHLELKKNQRIVCQNAGFAVVVPYWAIWPLETLLLSKRNVAAIDEFAADQFDLLADILHYPLRQSFRNSLPLFDGVSPASQRPAVAWGLLSPRPLLSSVAAFRHGAKVHGWVRVARFASTRYHAGKRRIASMRSKPDSLSTQNVAAAEANEGAPLEKN